jgi:hypothetical protein
MDEWIEEFRSRLLTENVSPELLALVIQRNERLDPRDIELAKTLTSCDVTFLGSWEINQLIEASLDDSAASKLAQAARSRLTRIAGLLPEVFRLTTKRTNFALRYTVQCLDDIVRDFSTSIPGASPRRDKILNHRLTTLAKTRQAVENVLSAFDLIKDDHGFAMEYRGLAAALYEIDADDETLARSRDEDDRATKLEGLTELLALSLTAIDVVTYDLQSDQPREPIRPLGMYKADVVSLAYDLFRSCGGPPLVTTPGSDFSLLCSIIYEMATGRRDESFAGAIIEFSRSRERRDTDEYDREVEEDELAHETRDNFYLMQRSSRRLRVDAAWYTDLLEKAPFDEPAKISIARMALSLLRQAKRNQDATGPFIVWAEQLPRAREDAWWREHEQYRERERELRIALGNMRRAAQTKAS